MDNLNDTAKSYDMKISYDVVSYDGRLIYKFAKIEGQKTKSAALLAI